MGFEDLWIPGVILMLLSVAGAYVLFSDGIMEISAIAMFASLPLSALASCFLPGHHIDTPLAYICIITLGVLQYVLIGFMIDRVRARRSAKDLSGQRGQEG